MERNDFEVYLKNSSLDSKEMKQWLKLFDEGSLNIAFVYPGLGEKKRKKDTYICNVEDGFLITKNPIKK